MVELPRIDLFRDENGKFNRVKEDGAFYGYAMYSVDDKRVAKVLYRTKSKNVGNPHFRNSEQAIEELEQELRQDSVINHDGKNFRPSGIYSVQLGLGPFNAESDIRDIPALVMEQVE